MAIKQPDPINRFAELFARAEAKGIEFHNAMLLSTVGRSGQPSSRMVLLKEFDARGFVFYTNFESRKGEQILASPKVALNFYWRELERQVSIEGRAQPVSDEEADAYFATRPRASQLGAWASQQSRPLENRARLLADVARIEARHLGGEVPRPPHWSGFRVVPERLEFWAGRPFRLHDRMLYERTADGWKATRLYP